MKKNTVPILWISIIGVLIKQSRGAETFIEELFISPLANGDISATFNFVILSPMSKSRHHSDLMPR